MEIDNSLKEEGLERPTKCALRANKLACGPAGRANDGGGLGPMFSFFDEVVFPQVSGVRAD